MPATCTAPDLVVESRPQTLCLELCEAMYRASWPGTASARIGAAGTTTLIRVH